MKEKRKGLGDALALLCMFAILMASASTAIFAEEVNDFSLTDEKPSVVKNQISKELFWDADKNAWYYQYLDEAAKFGIIEGYEDLSLQPDKDVTYGEFLAMALLHDGKGQEKKYGYWADTYYYKALELGIFNDSQINIRAMKEYIPRYDMALILGGLLDTKGLLKDEWKKTSVDYIDVDKREPFEYYISLCSNAGLLEGYGDDSFGPYKTLKRSEAMKVVIETLRIEAQEKEYSRRLETKDDILSSLFKSLRFVKEENQFLIKYNQPEIPKDMHLSINALVYQDASFDYAEIFNFKNDRDWRFYPENYNEKEHTEKLVAQDLKNATGKTIYFIAKLTELNNPGDYSSYAVYIEEDGSKILHTSIKKSGELKEEDRPLPKEMFLW